MVSAYEVNWLDSYKGSWDGYTRFKVCNGTHIWVPSGPGIYLLAAHIVQLGAGQIGKVFAANQQVPTVAYGYEP